MSHWFPGAKRPDDEKRPGWVHWLHLRTLHELDKTEGTVQLRKTEDSSSSSSLVLVPHPSETDPNDPLRWPRWKKYVAFLSICTFTFLTNFALGGLAPAFYILSQQFGKTQAETSALLTWPILVLGLFNFMWVPLANYFGKRPIFVFASLLLCVAYIWGAVATSFKSLLWSNIVAAFAGSSTEALAASMVNDLFFLHERGAKMGLYMNFISGGNTLGPLICGFVITGASWRWHKWLAVILTGVNFITVLLFVPETRYLLRDADQNVSNTTRTGKSVDGATGSSASPSDSDRAPDQSTSIANRLNMSSPPPVLPHLRGVSPTPPCPLMPRPMPSLISNSDEDKARSPSTATLRKHPAMDMRAASAFSALEGDVEGAMLAPPSVPKKTWAQELSLWSGTPPDSSLTRMFVRPLPMVVYPAVIFAFLAYAVALVVTVAVNILNPFVLQAPPYGWSPSINGLINIPGFIGNVIGGYAGGWLVDVFCDWRTRKNNGLFEPESRLWMLILPLLITGSGCLVFGYGVERTLHWTSLFFGYGMVSFALTAVPTITMAYVSDCLLPVNADALVLVNGFKNIVTFGFLYGIIPWANQAGYIDCFGTQAGVFVAIIGLGMAILIPFGAKVRHKQAQWRIIL